MMYPNYLHIYVVSSIQISLTTNNQQANINDHIKTHDSESRGQEEADCTQQTSELFTCSTALKFVNALNKPA